MSSKDNSSSLVSIIMPTYNRANYILETIHSIQNQTYDKWELIVLDDGSVDNTEELVKAMNDSRIQYYKFVKCGIVGKLKNTGIDLAKGEFIAFMDSDDLWSPEKLQLQIDTLNQYPEAGFSITNGLNFYTDHPSTVIYQQTEGFECSNIFSRVIQSRLGIYTISLMLRSSCLQDVGRFNEDKPFTDFSFHSKLAYHSKAVVIYTPLFLRRVHPANSSDMNWFYDYAENIDAIVYSRKMRYVDEHTANQALFIVYCNMGETYLSKDMWRKAMESFFIAWKFKPRSIIPVKKSIKAIFLSIRSLF